MPPIRQTQYTAYSNRHMDNLSQLAQIHGGRLSCNTTCPQPYAQRIPTAHAQLPLQNLAIPTNLLEKISQVQGAAVNKMTQAKDTSRLRKFLTFCQGLGISGQQCTPGQGGYSHGMAIILCGSISWENCWREDPGYKEGTSEVRTSMAGQPTFAPDA